MRDGMHDDGDLFLSIHIASRDEFPAGHPSTHGALTCRMAALYFVHSVMIPLLCHARQTRHHRSPTAQRSEEHTSELQSLMRNSYAVFCLKKKKQNTQTPSN